MNKKKAFLFVVGSLLLIAYAIPFKSKSTPKQDNVLLTTAPDVKIIDPKDPPCIQMYYCIEHYAEKYNVPKRYAYAIAYYETRYQGPFHWEYNHALGSEIGALGPMQILHSTDRIVNGTPVSPQRLKTDIEYNVRTSMKLLRLLHDKYGDWRVVFGIYSSGKAAPNFYSDLVCNFKIKWRWEIA